MDAGTDVEERRELRRKVRAATLDALRALGGEASRRAVHDRALADGGFTPRELGATRPDHDERLVDHLLSWELTNLKRDGLLDNPSRAMWRLVGAAAETSPEPLAEQVPTDRIGVLRTMPYREYLRTPEWRRVRAAALLRARNACSLDVTHTEGLEVHHRTYERRGDELPGDVVVLCRACHLVHHGEHGRPGPTPKPDLGTASVPVAPDRYAIRTHDNPDPSRWRRLFSRG